MPIRMTYQPSIHSDPLEIDVYHIQHTVDTLECVATGWLIKSETWVTVPIFMLTPCKKKTKKKLTEGD